MTPYQQAQKLYCASHEYGWNLIFDGDLKFHLDHAYVFASPEYFTMGFPCSSVIVKDCIRRHRTMKKEMGWQDTEAKADTWFVWIATGGVRKALSFIPHKLKYVAFARRGVLRIWPFEKLTSAIERLCSTSSTSLILEPPTHQDAG